MTTHAKAKRMACGQANTVASETNRLPKKRANACFETLINQISSHVSSHIHSIQSFNKIASILLSKRTKHSNEMISFSLVKDHLSPIEHSIRKYAVCKLESILPGSVISTEVSKFRKSLEDAKNLLLKFFRNLS